MNAKPKQPLVVNKIISREPCRWCEAMNKPHTPACPCGERYRHIQAIGGVPFAIAA